MFQPGDSVVMVAHEKLTEDKPAYSYIGRVGEVRMGPDESFGFAAYYVHFTVSEHSVGMWLPAEVLEAGDVKPDHEVGG